MRVRKVWLLFAVLACSCASTPVKADARQTDAREVVLGPGESHRVEEWDLRVTFEGVTSDSRCPRGVTCVWSGDAAVALTIEGGGAARAAYTLHTHEADKHEAAHGQVRVRLVALQPEPTASGPVRAEDYRVTLQLHAKK